MLPGPALAEPSPPTVPLAPGLTAHPQLGTVVIAVGAVTAPRHPNRPARSGADAAPGLVLRPSAIATSAALPTGACGVDRRRGFRFARWGDPVRYQPDLVRVYANRDALGRVPVAIAPVEWTGPARRVEDHERRAGKP